MKKGDKYIIEIQEVHNHYDDNDNKYKLGRVKGFSSLVFDEFGLSRLKKITDENCIDHDTLLSSRNFYMKKYHELRDKNAELKKENKKLDKMLDIAIKKVFSLSETISTMVYGEEEDLHDYCEDGFNGAYWSKVNQMKAYKDRLAKQIPDEQVGTDEDIFEEQTANILGDHKE